jgi:Cu+-exporting ATPase
MLDKAATLNLPGSANASRSGEFAKSTSSTGGPEDVQSRDTPTEPSHCFHCGTACGTSVYRQGDKAFCCNGCLAVFELLTENGLGDFYELGVTSGVKGAGTTAPERFKFVDAPGVRELLVDFSNERLTRATFRLPAIHCIACVWLLENLFRLKPGIGSSRVNFPKKELTLSFRTDAVKLSEVLTLLSSLGYEPELKLSDLGGQRKTGESRRLWLQLGVAGFAFGNTMLFSVASYLGLDSTNGPGFRRFVGVVSLLLSIPVFTYSALDYWRSAWRSLRQGLLNIDVPITAGVVALTIQSTYEALRGGGVGYFDSLAGLLFFLLCGKLFQQKTFGRLAFDRDYRSFFPLSVRRRTDTGDDVMAVSQLKVGDRLLIRNGELIPADGHLVSGSAMIDYSFVTGESEPVGKAVGEHVYAGGRQVGAAIEVRTIKPVSEGYLTSLWNQEAFCKPDLRDSLNTLTNRYSQRFTKLVMAIAIGAGLFWAYANPHLAVKAFTSVLIVACPCALALAAPFALGTAQRVLAQRNVFLKNPIVLERLAAARTIVFDKTGTLTAGIDAAVFEGRPLDAREASWVRSLAAQSTHPQANRIVELLENGAVLTTVDNFVEVPGSGLSGLIEGHRVLLGSPAWLRGNGVAPETVADGSTRAGSVVRLAIDGSECGQFMLSNALRPDTENLIRALRSDYELSLVSGDRDREKERFGSLFGDSALHFNQRPLDKLAFVSRRQKAGQTVVMVGDGLNDAGALRQSDVGIAVVEKIGAFSPASDVIMAAEKVPDLVRVMRYAKSAVRVVQLSFVLSAIYNAVGIAIAARGLLAPVVCAVLMPLSSVTVVAFACGAAGWVGKRLLGPPTASLADDQKSTGALTDNVSSVNDLSLEGAA